MVELNASQLFRDLDEAEIAALQAITCERDVAAGVEIFREGDPGDGLYILKQGWVEISVQVAPDLRRPLARVGPGEMFGEMSVVESKPRSATATALEASRVCFIPCGELLGLIARKPKLALELLREISQRLRESNHRHLEEILQAERLAFLGRFARGIVHDLKNPLHVIGLAAEMACMDHASPDLRLRAAQNVRKQVDRIADMVGEILEFTQPTRKELFLLRVDYAEYLRELREEITPTAELRGIMITLDEPLPPVRVRVDPRRLNRVFHNLIQNTADALPQGGNSIWQVRVKDREVITSISDNGPGIAPEIAGKLFEPFATFGKNRGSGLGLSICKKIIEDHHGRIWAGNTPERGALFCFTLPLDS